ncbi:MAG: aminopeptidase P family protein [Bacteroidota bacterium]
MNLPPFSDVVYQKRRSELCEKVGHGLILIAGNHDAPMNYAANIYPFRQDSNFRYYAGIDRPGLHLLMDAATGEATLYGQDLSLDDIVWMGTQASIRELAQLVGVSTCGSPEDLNSKLERNSSGVHYLPPYRERRKNWLQKYLGHSDQPSKVLTEAVIAMRSVKSEGEIVEMERAVNTSRAMHHAAMDAAKSGMLEAEIAGLIEGIAIQAGGRLAYPAIVTRHGHILHNHDHTNELQEGDLLLIDSGAEATSGYAGDITRTFCIGQEMDDRQEAVYNIVKEAEESVIRDLRPGVLYRTYHDQASIIIAKGLKELGLMKGDPEEAVAAGAHALFFPHGLGHMIGLDVHDMEDLGENMVGYDEQVKRSDQFGTAYLRLGKSLQTGYVITVEPGIYFIPALMDQWQTEGKFKNFIDYNAVAAYRDFGGIRIEDNVLITDSGSRVLGEPIRK